MRSLVFLAVVAVVSFLAVTAGSLYVTDRFRKTRSPTRAERAQIDALREVAGLSVEPVAILETDPQTLDVEIAVRGIPRRRVLFVTEDVLEAIDEDVAVALLAAEAGRVETRYTEFRGIAVAVVISILAAIVTTLVPFDSGFTALAVIGFASFWVGRRVQYAADVRAAERVGADRLADAFETVAARQDVVPGTGSWRTWFEVQPPLGDRIERLRERARERTAGES